MKYHIPYLIAALFAFAFSAHADIKEDVERTAIRYFVENANPDTGLVRDKVNSFPRDVVGDRDQLDVYPEASTAATGYGLTILANAAERGLISRSFVEAYFNKVMRFCSDKSRMPREHGFFLHWVNWQTGKIVWEDFNEYSSIDSAFLVAGALYAAKIFPNSEGARLAQQIYREMDFIWLMTDGGRFPDRRTLSLGYNKNGFTSAQWSIYAEQMILVVLGLGHPDHPLPPEVWTQWERRAYPAQKPYDYTLCFHPETAGAPCIVALDMPLFVHQYSQLFLDFRHFHDRYPNYFTTSRDASAYNRTVAGTDGKLKTLTEGFWGFSAGQIRDAGTSDGENYHVYDPTRYSSTACIACMLGSAMFLPEVTLADAAAWRAGKFGEKIWGRYGFTDSIDLEGESEWFSNKSLAITVGSEYLSLANVREDTSIWHVFHAIPEIARALDRIRE